MENQQQSDLLTNIGGEELAGSGFEMEEPTRLDEVISIENPTQMSEEDAQ